MLISSLRENIALKVLVVLSLILLRTIHCKVTYTFKLSWCSLFLDLMVLLYHWELAKTQVFLILWDIPSITMVRMLYNCTSLLCLSCSVGEYTHAASLVCLSFVTIWHQIIVAICSGIVVITEIVTYMHHYNKPISSILSHLVFMSHCL